MKLFARASNKKGRRKFRIGWKLALLALPLAAFFAVLSFYGVWAKTVDMKKVGDMPERNTVFDVDGKIYSRLAGANRLKVALNEVSPFFVDAVIAREDTRFFEHGGIDWRGIARALIKDILSASAKEGASSLTQQLARTVSRSVAARSAEKSWKRWWLCESNAISRNSKSSSFTLTGF